MKKVLFTIIVATLLLLQTNVSAKMLCPDAKILMPMNNRFFTITTDEEIRVCVSVGLYTVFNTHGTFDGTKWDLMEVTIDRKTDNTEIIFQPGTYLIIRDK